MSARAAADFGPLLRKVGRGLRAPLTRRTRILRELSSDLDSLYRDLVDEGIPPDEARRRAAEALVPDGRTLRALEDLHAPRYRRFTAKLDGERLRRIERGALAAVTASVVVAEAAALLRVDLLRDPSPFLWPVLVLGAVLAGTWMAVAFRLWVKGEDREPRRGLDAILGLTGLTLAAGLMGVLFDFHRLAATLEEAPHRAAEIVPGWLLRDVTVLCVALLLALAGALGWMVLRQWVVLTEAAEREILAGSGRPYSSSSKSRETPS